MLKPTFGILLFLLFTCTAWAGDFEDALLEAGVDKAEIPNVLAQTTIRSAEKAR